MSHFKFKPFIPGYTGHLPSDFFERPLPEIKPVCEGHIPGYAGFVHKIKQDNYFGKSFGAITSEINQSKPSVSDKYISMNQLTFVDQNKIKVKKASEILKLNLSQKQFIQPSAAEMLNLSKTVKRIEVKAPQTDLGEKVDPQNVTKLVSNTDFIHDSIPGYTGHTSKVYSKNIHGMSFKRAQNESRKMLHQQNTELRSTISKICLREPDIFVSRR